MLLLCSNNILFLYDHIVLQLIKYTPPIIFITKSNTSVILFIHTIDTLWRCTYGEFKIISPSRAINYE